MKQVKAGRGKVERKQERKRIFEKEGKAKLSNKGRKCREE